MHWNGSYNRCKVKGKGFPYSTPSVGPGADPGVQAVSLLVTVSHPPGGRLPLLSTRPVVTSPIAEHHRPLASTKLHCLVTEAHRCKQLAQGCYTALPRAGFEPATYWSHAQMPYPLHHRTTGVMSINAGIVVLTKRTSAQYRHEKQWYFDKITKYQSGNWRCQTGGHSSCDSNAEWVCVHLHCKHTHITPNAVFILYLTLKNNNICVSSTSPAIHLFKANAWHIKHCILIQ